MGSVCFRCPRCGFYDCSHNGEEECPMCGLKVKLNKEEINSVIRGAIKSETVEVINVEYPTDVLESNR